MQSDRFPYPESDYSSRVVQEPTTDGYVVYSASYVELPGCESQGDTEQEARENLRDAFELYVTDLVQRGLPVPPPAKTQVREVVSYVVTSSGTAHISSSIQYGDTPGIGFSSDVEASRALVGSSR